MPSVGKLCVYCAKPIAEDDRVACCDRCFAAHHEDCWERNGRCSTFRCAGLPRTMLGRDLPLVLRTANERSNEQPASCPYCGNTTYAGQLTGHWGGKGPEQPAGPGLWFRSREKEDDGGIRKRLLGRLKRGKAWWLPGAAIKSRSCGRCKRLFLWGTPIDEAFLQSITDDERFCAHCSTQLHAGEIALKGNSDEGARFVCDEAPDFHKDWIRHAVLDQFVLNRWNPALKSLPAHSCPDCQYTEIAGRPIYRFL